uniref:Lysyl oxidase homolog n=1 Tax=Cyprinus carpio TaxID=7962 RepID=A0A8C2Q3B0_CYPCA
MAFSSALCIFSLLALVQAQSESQHPKIQLRLAGDKVKHYEGRLEVFYNNEWGTICDDDFSIEAAHVACRELGFLGAVAWSPSAKFGQGEGRIWLDNVHCTGGEKSLAECPSNGFGVSDCRHSEDVGVVCNQKRIPGHRFTNTMNNNVETIEERVEEIRIRPISSHLKRLPISEGFVEIKERGKWRQICDEHWTPLNSRVVCGMYGFPGEKKYSNKSTMNLIPLKKDTFSALVSKRNGVWNDHHANFFRLILQQPLVRLRGGANIGEGRVEVLKNGVWGTVCDDNWNLRAATVVCRELGFGSAKEALTGAKLGQGMGPVHMNEVDCSGFEKSLTDCYFNNDALGCSHEEDAAVRCNIPAMGFQKRIRLSGGRNPYEGRVEVLTEKNGSLVWGTVCSENWGMMEAMVVCRQLGLGFASNAFQETWYWAGDASADNVVMSGVRCSGTEMSLPHCLHHGKHINCPRGGGRFAAGVSCSDMAPDLVLNAQLVEQTTYLEDRPMYALQCALEENCLSSTAKKNDHSTYRRLLRFSSQIHNVGQSDFRPKLGHHAWTWHECHRHYHSIEVFTHYDLLSLNGTKVAEGHKASFCLEDTQCDEGIQKRYVCANFGEQGITVGCWDTYRHDIDCQWIDITDVKPGDYILQVVINPNYDVAESDYTNNFMKCKCRYDGYRIWTYQCLTGGSRSSDMDEYPGMSNQLHFR